MTRLVPIIALAMVACMALEAAAAGRLRHAIGKVLKGAATLVLPCR